MQRLFYVVGFLYLLFAGCAGFTLMQIELSERGALDFLVAGVTAAGLLVGGWLLFQIALSLKGFGA
jgi:hypothetical protein